MKNKASKQGDPLDDQEQDGEPTTGAEMVAEVRKLFADAEAGKRIDVLLGLWKTNLENRAAQAKAHGAATERAFKIRTITSGVIVALVCLAGWQKVITGEAVVGLLSGCLGYLWGVTKNNGKE